MNDLETMEYEETEVIVDCIFIDNHQNLLAFKNGMLQVECTGCTDFSVLKFYDDNGNEVEHTKIDKYNIQGMTYQGIIGLDDAVPRLEARLCEIEKDIEELREVQNVIQKNHMER